ncbi:MAG: alpha/beta hydrolase [Chloracidobacterium sp. CP2_5A]|nr:MAG: alpha/beta hydrolase [Chloracidobacterium sp. CP2_5A]
MRRARRVASRVNAMQLGALGAATRAVTPRAYLLERLSARPFVPDPRLTNPHLQTILGSVLPRRSPLADQTGRPRAFQTRPDTTVTAVCHWQSGRGPADCPTLLLLHGMEGSVESSYMRGMAEKGLRAGFHVIRLNTRTCGGTEHLSPHLYNAGLTEDVHAVLTELGGRDGATDVYVVGVSLAGNVVLRLAGEYGMSAPRHARGVVAISPSVDLTASAAAMERRSNWFYHRRFVQSLKARLKRKAALFPDRYDARHLAGIRTIREFDAAYTARAAGYASAEDYYHRASAARVAEAIRLPTLIIHAQDDPFIPVAPLYAPAFAENPSIALLLTERGGHVGFLAAPGADADRRWAEHRVVDFVRALDAARRR